jgi:hypothetical protein
LLPKSFTKKELTMDLPDEPIQRSYLFPTITKRTFPDRNKKHAHPASVSKTIANNDSTSYVLIRQREGGGTFCSQKPSQKEGSTPVFSRGAAVFRSLCEVGFSLGRD